jgi:asparagine synthase (glutamine-hydrolysing)
MCGFVVIMNVGRGRAMASEGRFTGMLDSIGHRGPDDRGIWSDVRAGVAIGHVRLAIIDTTSAGRQPMTSPSSRYILAFNGEIYNHPELAQELKSEIPGLRFLGTSDTEVMLRCVEHWGIERTIKKLVGMFAIALWDTVEESLTLVRDRAGEKPLYYGVIDGELVVCSELHAMSRAYSSHLRVSSEAIFQFLHLGYVPAPISIYNSISKLPPGHCIKLLRSGSLDAPRPYWCLPQDRLPDALPSGQPIKIDDAVFELNIRMRQAILGQLHSDVPIGALLSGGIDSSLVCAIAQSQSTSRLKTFTIGFAEREFDEAEFAAKIAAHLGTEHTTLYVDTGHLLHIVPQLATIYDEPFADSSQIPTALLSNLIRKHVTVALSGDGADELFGGYTRYIKTLDAWSRVGKLRPSARCLMADAIDRMLRVRRVGPLGLVERGSHRPWSRNQVRLSRLGHMLRASSFDEFYVAQNCIWNMEDIPARGIPRNGAMAPSFTVSDPLYQMRRIDFESYLPDDILVKVDRASMKSSLEVRAPYLDHKIIEFAMGLPNNVLFSHGAGKFILRELLASFVPPHLFERPKKGFSVPLGQWMRGPLRAWCNEALRLRNVSAHIEVDTRSVNRIWEQHTSGRADRSAMLWPFIILDTWLENQLRK